MNEEVENIKREITSVNKRIVELEEKETDSFRKSLEENLKEKEAELAAHDLTKPEKVEPPTDPDVVAQNKETSDEISIKRNSLRRVDEEILSKQTELMTLRLEVAELGKTLQSLTLFEHQFQKLQSEITPILERHKINFSDIVSLRLDKSKLEDLVNEKNRQGFDN